MRDYLRRRWRLRVAVLRLFPLVGARLLVPTVALQIVSGLLPVAFIIATSAVLGRIPAAVEHGLDSAEWRSLRNALLVEGVLFVFQQVTAPLQWMSGEQLAWRVDDALRQRATAAWCGPLALSRAEDEELMDTPAAFADRWRRTGITPGPTAMGALFL